METVPSMSSQTNSPFIFDFVRENSYSLKDAIFLLSLAQHAVIAIFREQGLYGCRSNPCTFTPCL